MSPSAHARLRPLRQLAPWVVLSGVTLLAASAFAQSFAPGEVRVSSSPYVPPPQNAALHTSAKEVQVEVVVRDPKGMPVGGVTEDQFQLLDKGQPRKLTAFTAEVTNSAAPISAYSRPKSSTASSAPNPSTLGSRPRFVALFFDDIHMVPGDFAHAQIAAERFVKEAMAPGDRVGVFTASSAVAFDFSNDQSKLVATIVALRARPMLTENVSDCPRLTPYQAMQIVNGDLMAFEAAFLEYRRCHISRDDSSQQLENMDPSLLNNPFYIRSHPGVTQVRELASSLWDRAKEASALTFSALRATMDRLAVAPGERMLLLASSGFLSDQLEQTENEVTAEAVRTRIVVNALDARGLFVEGPGRPLDVPGTPGDLPLATFLWENTTRGEKQQAEQAAMENFAKATGGLLFRNNNDLDYGFYELGVVPGFSYILSFSADDVRPDGSYHPLKVKVDRPNCYPEFRPGYYAPASASASESAKPQAPPEHKLDQAVQLQEDLAEIPVTAVAKPAKSASGAPELAVTLHIDVRSLPFEQKDDRELERLDLVVALFDSQNNFVIGKHGTFELALKEDSLTRLKATGINGTLSLEAPPGTYRLRAVAQEALTGKTAATSQSVQIQ
jgi:VWFA-related protein